MKNRIESNRIGVGLVSCRFGTGVAKTEPEPNRTEPFRGVDKHVSHEKRNISRMKKDIHSRE
jgi:hypothetical protein